MFLETVFGMKVIRSLLSTSYLGCLFCECFKDEVSKRHPDEFESQKSR